MHGGLTCDQIDSWNRAAVDLHFLKFPEFAPLSHQHLKADMVHLQHGIEECEQVIRMAEIRLKAMREVAKAV